MTAKPSLRNRVALTLATFAAAVGITLASVIYLASHDLERRLIDETLNAELDDSIARRQRNPQSLPERTATIRAFVVAPTGATAPVPPEVAALPPGQHQLDLDGTPYRAAVRQIGPQRFVVLYDVSALRRREQGFVLLLAASVVLITLISALSGRWLASRVIAPVTELARRVTELRPDDPPPDLAREFPWYEIQQLAADFDTYLGRLHAFMERERLFTADVSHELRTPLAVISGAADLLLADAALAPPNRTRAARIGRAAAEMGEMTGALLALAREQDPRSAPAATCDAASVAQELVERYGELFRDKRLELAFEIAGRPQVQADRAVLSMVLGNLLRNALSFTEAGQVRVRVESDGIELQDTGPGIGGGEAAQLFRPYRRGAGSQGAGLGLSLVQRLCDRHGWRINLENLPVGGAVARLRFGAGPAAPPASKLDLPQDDVAL